MSGSDVRRLKRELRRSGCQVVQSKGTSHYKVYRDGLLLGVFPSTPSDHRSLLNCRALFRRKGVL